MSTKIDMHSHTRGSDGTGTPEQIALAAKQAGIDVLCLTDHHTNLTDEVKRVAQALRDVGIVPIIGIEYSTAQGHLLIYGVDVPLDAWGRYPDMQAVIDDVNALGGACVVPHPYKGYQRAIRDGVKYLRGLAAIEVLNGQVECAEPETNRKARAAAEAFNVPMCAGSDAHVPSKVGMTYTLFDADITTEEQFIGELRAGRFKPVRNETMWNRYVAQREAARALAKTTPIPSAPRYFAAGTGRLFDDGGHLPYQTIAPPARYHTKAKTVRRDRRTSDSPEGAAPPETDFPESLLEFDYAADAAHGAHNDDDG